MIMFFAHTHAGLHILPYGATEIVRGSRHPALKDWKGEENLSVLYAAGVLG